MATSGSGRRRARRRWSALRRPQPREQQGLSQFARTTSRCYRRNMRITTTAVLCATAFTAVSPNLGRAQQPAPTIASRTAGFERRDGFIAMHVDPKSGKLLLELPRDSTRALLLVSQATGFGSNPIGIDRGASADEQVVRFERDGDRVLVVFENWRYRSSAATNADHRRTIAEAFPSSTIASMPILADE